MFRFGPFTLIIFLCALPLSAQAAFSLKSSGFESGQPIPVKYTGDGENVSPPLEWNSVPPGTKELALICEDPDAPSPEPWVHWVVAHLPASLSSLPEGMTKGTAGRNSFGKIGYSGPKPPKGDGWHRYFFRLYALDRVIPVPQYPSKEALLKAMQNHVIGEADVMGKYQR